MPFARHALVTLTNEGAADADVVAYAVAYTLGELRDPTLRLHATFAESSTSESRPDHVIIDVDETAGSYVGTALAWTARQPGWWGEGQVKFYLDGDDLPSIVGSGAEDYFGGAWAFGQDAAHAPGPHGLTARPFNSAFLGCPLLETDDAVDRRISLYRWHLSDPVHFRRNLRVTVQALGWGDDGRYRVRDDHIASVAYWYRRRR
jgi:hypothetical protein